MLYENADHLPPHRTIGTLDYRPDSLVLKSIEVKILYQMAQGSISRKKIAENLSCSQHVVKQAIADLLKSFKAENRIELIAKAFRERIII